MICETIKYQVEKFEYMKLQRNPVITISVINEHLVIMSQIGHSSTQIYQVMTNPGYNEQNWLVVSCLL
jgi:hypothetical protein